MIDLVVAHQAVPPLVRDLVRHHKVEIAALATLLVEIVGNDDQTGIFNAAGMCSRLNHVQFCKGVRPKVARIRTQRIGGDLRRALAAGFVAREVKRAEGHIIYVLRDHFVIRAHRQHKVAHRAR